MHTESRCSGWLPHAHALMYCMQHRFSDVTKSSAFLQMAFEPAMELLVGCSLKVREAPRRACAACLGCLRRPLA